MNKFIDVLYAYVIKHRNSLVGVFKVFFLLQIALFFIGAWSIYSQNSFWPLFYDIGKTSGEMAIVFFIFSCVPGIVRRFGYFNKLVSILMIFRRYIGIATYLFVLIHSGFVRIVPWIAQIFPLYPIEAFVVFGVIAHIVLFLLFVTSNDLSINKLGVWWHRIHNFMYIIVWIIFLHVALLKISIWTVLIGATAVAEVASFMKRRV